MVTEANSIWWMAPHSHSIITRNGITIHNNMLEPQFSLRMREKSMFETRDTESEQQQQKAHSSCERKKKKK